MLWVRYCPLLRKWFHFFPFSMENCSLAFSSRGGISLSKSRLEYSVASKPRLPPLIFHPISLHSLLNFQAHHGPAPCHPLLLAALLAALMATLCPKIAHQPKITIHAKIMMYTKLTTHTKIMTHTEITTHMEKTMHVSISTPLMTASLHQLMLQTMMQVLHLH